jgi:symplekin
MNVDSAAFNPAAHAPFELVQSRRKGLAKPKILTSQQVSTESRLRVQNQFRKYMHPDEEAPPEVTPSFTRLPAEYHDKGASMTLVSRLATRPTFALQRYNDATDALRDGSTRDGTMTKKVSSFDVGDSVRDGWYHYVLVDFRARQDTAIDWLAEEWGNEQILTRFCDRTGLARPDSNYERTALRLLDGFVPFLDANDRKLIIRFFGECPAVTVSMLDRLKRLADDPERVKLTIESL